MEKHKPGLREILTSLVFIVFVGVLFVLNIFIPAPDVLVGERRIPAKLPELSTESILSGSFMSKFDDYAADNFVFRDTFRGIHSFVVFDIFMQTDKSGIYRTKSVGTGEFRHTDAKSFRQTSERIKKVAESFNDMDMNIYYSMVPDKSFFAGRYMPGFDLETAETILFDVLADYKYIPLMDNIGANSFYKTDLHWNQPKITETANYILSSMGADPDTSSFSETRAGAFRGVYAGQLALPMDPDIMIFLKNPDLEVKYLSDKTLEFEPGPVYDTERFTGVDPYDLFLRGPQPLIVIENTAVPERELYLFRDSFGSSLAPLLAGSYSKVTVIDLRYIHFSLITQFIKFERGSDVLFIYGSQIFNNPSILQI